MQPISEYLFQYLAKKIPEFSKIKKSGQNLFTCPKIHSHKFKSQTPTATFLPNSDKINCLICGFKGTTYDVVRELEEDKKNRSDAEITEYLISILELDLYKEFDIYLKYGWSLVALLKNTNKPFEDDWREKDYFEKVKWIKWVNNGLNIGLNCEKSKATVVDVDCKHPVATEEAKKLREEIIELCKKENTLTADTPSRGNHYVFQWEEDLRKQVVNGCGTQIDTRTTGQIAIAPSIRDNKAYIWRNLGGEIRKMSSELKSKLLLFQSVEKGRNKDDTHEESDLASYEGEKPTLINNDLSGCRNNAFTQLGGLLTKLEISNEKRATIMYWLNRNWLENPRGTEEIKATLGSLAGYEENNEKTHEQAIYDYMKLVQSDISARDIMDALKLPRGLVDKYLSKFVKDGRAVRMGRGRYQYKEKIEWSDSVPEIINEYKYKIPFFNNIAIFQDADCLILGGKTNEGKTTIALNILKEIIQQDVKPYYIYTEAGSRFQKTAKSLNIESKFYHCQHSNPMAIELESNAFTVIDWLFLENKAETDTVLKHINDELQRKRGMLVIFTQLKQDYGWFAPNLIDHFPTFAARYFQDNENHTEGHWDISKIKEPRGSYINYTLQCVYDHESRIFKPRDLI